MSVCLYVCLCVLARVLVYLCECVYLRALVGMVMYNSETKEIAKPSELLNSIKAIMNVLQSIENYGITLYTVSLPFLPRDAMLARY